MNDKFLNQMEREYDYHQDEGHLFKIRHLKITLQDMYLTEYDNFKDCPTYIQNEYMFILDLEKRLIETSEDGYGFELSKDEMKRCNSLYKKYSKKA